MQLLFLVQIFFNSLCPFVGCLCVYFSTHWNSPRSERRSGLSSLGWIIFVFVLVKLNIEDGVATEIETIVKRQQIL